MLGARNHFDGWVDNWSVGVKRTVEVLDLKAGKRYYSLSRPRFSM
jgi:hypothetical protein